MLPHFTKYRRRLPFIPALIICATAMILYKIFKSPELDQHIGKVMEASTSEN